MMSARTLLVSSTALFFASPVLADSCLIKFDGVKAGAYQCQEYGGQMSGPIAEQACKMAQNFAVKEGVTMSTEYRKEPCPTENVALRCGIGEMDGKYQIVSVFYKLSGYEITPEEACQKMQGKVL